MKLSTESTVLPITQSIEIVQYCSSLHHNYVPQIYSESFGEEPWSDNWEDFDKFDPNGVFLAISVINNTPVGFIISFKKWDLGYISVVAVLPAYRRKGIATALIRSAVYYLKSLNLSEIMIDVETTNMPALNAYENFGFRIIETFED